MASLRQLPVLLPSVAHQRWSCHSCGYCCRELAVHLFESDRRRLDAQAWQQQLGVEPYVRAGRGWVLNKRPDGACVFLDADNRCTIHAKLGIDEKPLACRLFPFSVRAVDAAWQASLRFDCPSVAYSRGEPLGQHRAWLSDAAGQLEHATPHGDEAVDLARGLPARAEEVTALVTGVTGWIRHGDSPVLERLVGAARLTQMLATSKLKKVRGPRFVELVALLVGAMPNEVAQPVEPPTRRQSAMLRQLVFVHAEHVTVDELNAGFVDKARRRWQQLDSARRFRVGKGAVPSLPSFDGEASFESVAAVRPAAGDVEAIEQLLLRYVVARLEGRGVFGSGYYGWSALYGMAALWLGVASAGWLARLAASLDGSELVTLAHAARAIGVIDRAATRVPAVGTVTERVRVSYLIEGDGLARLLAAFRMTETTTCT